MLKLARESLEPTYDTRLQDAICNYNVVTFETAPWWTPGGQSIGNDEREGTEWGEPPLIMGATTTEYQTD